MSKKQPTGGQKLPSNEIEKMLASAKEMENVLNKKLAEIDAASFKKSEMAKHEAAKIKLDVEEIKRLSLIQTKEGEEALKAKIMQVNERIESTTRKAAQLQEAAVDRYKKTLDDIREITNNVLKMLSINEKKISKDQADLILNRVMTFEKHAALRTDFALRVLQDVKRIVGLKINPCTADNTPKTDLMVKVEYYAKLINSLCPGTVRPGVVCPAETLMRKRRPQSQ